MAEVIRSSGQSLERLLSDVLDLARVEAGQLTIEATPFNAADLMRAVQALCASCAPTRKGLVAGPPRSRQSWRAGSWATRCACARSCTNLTSNAVKFTENGSVTIVGEMAEPGRLRFTVVDTGVGFDLAQKERLFARFQQADGSITRRFGGSGLGLAISRQLAALMAGEIDCESEPGRGSKFWFEAPFAVTRRPPAAPCWRRGRWRSPPAAAPVRVLVADDHATNQLVVKMMLEQFGMEAVVVDEAAPRPSTPPARETFDVVLMDMQMPVMGGLEATRLIRSNEIAAKRPHTPILMLSANALKEHRDAARQAGADGHLAKPVTVAGLMAALNGVLDSEPDGADEPLVAAG